MGRWFLVRHGETDWNAAGRAQGQSQVPLNATGQAQARTLAARLRLQGFTAAYASDLRRVTETAAAILRGRDVPLVALPALREKHFGEWEGMTFAEVEARYPERYAELFSGDGSFAPPGGESDRQLFQRVAAGVDRLREAHRPPPRKPAAGGARRLAVRGDRAPAGAARGQYVAVPAGQRRTVRRYPVRRRRRGTRSAQRHQPPGAGPLGVEGVNGELILLLGGARAGKSAAAEQLARAGRRVLFIATAEALDEDMRRRIAAHRARRPSGWDTLEEPLDPVTAAGPILDRYDTVVLDCLTLWVSNLLLRHPDDSGTEAAILDAAGGLLDLIERSTATWIVISNEVGLGVVPPAPLGRTYRDALGRVNQLAAARAGRVYLIVAGLALELKELNAQPFSQLDC